MRIVVMEDNNNKYETIKKYLNRLGEEDIERYATLNKGTKALYDSILEEKRVDLLILDMNMPRFEDRMNDIVRDAGISVIKRLESIKINIKIVLCSSEEIDIDLSKYKNVIGVIKYDASVNQSYEFEKYVKRVYNEQPEETYVNIYYSFDSNSIKKCGSRKEALDYIKKDFEEEVRIQTQENNKVIGVDIQVINEIEDDEYAKISFLNGDIIEWSIPEIID